jgi:chorismate lyase / 3-hydroxybenzoate synthase
MRANSPNLAQAVVQPLVPNPPDWVDDLLTKQPWPRFTLLSQKIGNATALSSDRLTQRVAHAYGTLLSDMRSHQRHPVRMWNFVPDIHGAMDYGDRYMAFNAGRFAAFTGAFGIPGGKQKGVPTASAVGVAGTTLWIYVLSADRAGVAIENPRQIPAYLYSLRYGPRPPYFARATRFDSLLLLGGTASIVGEDSRHVANIGLQTQETLCNLRALISAATGQPDGRALAALRDLRVHVTDSRHAAVVREMLEPLLPDTTIVEYVEAQLCRKELLVEIEGVAACV